MVNLSVMSTLENNGKSLQGSETLRVFAVSDVVEPQIYNSGVADWLGPVDIMFSCGDLPPYYLDFLVSTFHAPMFHVLGNHCDVPHDSVTNRCSPGAYAGAQNLNGRLAEYRGLLLGGVEGSPVYNRGPHQYNEQQMELNLLRLVPGMILNKVRTGRYLDVLLTHAPPRGIHDNTDIAHRGFTSLIPFIERFKPALLLHGHTHRYDPMQPVRTRYAETEIVNAYGHVLLDLSRDNGVSAWKVAATTESRRG
ncbi:MAG: metallophosphoesterase [Chloroflexota bacterium]